MTRRTATRGVVPFGRSTRSRPRTGRDPAGDLDQALKRMERAGAAWNAGRHVEAIADLREAIALEAACLGSDCAAVATAYPLLGAYLMLSGDLAEAEAVLSSAIGLLAPHPDRQREHVAARALLAELHVKAGRPADARALLGDLEVDCEAAYGPRSPELARVVLALAGAQEGCGDCGNAAVTFERALDLCEKAGGGPDFADPTQVALGGLVRLNFAAGRHKTALAYLDRLLVALPDDDDDGVFFACEDE